MCEEEDKFDSKKKKGPTPNPPQEFLGGAHLNPMEEIKRKKEKEKERKLRSPHYSWTHYKWL